MVTIATTSKEVSNAFIIKFFIGYLIENVPHHSSVHHHDTKVLKTAVFGAFFRQIDDLNVVLHRIAP